MILCVFVGGCAGRLAGIETAVSVGFVVGGIAGTFAGGRAAGGPMGGLMGLSVGAFVGIFAAGFVAANQNDLVWHYLFFLLGAEAVSFCIAYALALEKERIKIRARGTEE